MKKQFFLVLALSTFSLFACEQEYVIPGPDPKSNPEPTSATALIISSFFPEHAIAGTEMVIFGENFGATMTDNYVTFSGEYAEVTGIGHGMVMVRVPKNLSPGFYTISLSANGRTCASTSLFTIM